MTATRRLDEFRLHADGFEIRRNAVSAEAVAILREAIAETVAGEGVKPYGVRSIAGRCRKVGELVRGDALRQIVDAGIREPWLLVRSILFEKVPGANWHVGWHQDLAVAVRERPDSEIPGFGGWTEKDGVPHVLAPSDLLGQMITLRVHLDDAGPENGPLRVIPGSHRGRIDSEEIRARIESGPLIECAVRAGDILVMRPMLLHASQKAEAPEHRRVVHLEFGPADGLPEGLEWASASSSRSRDHSAAMQ